MMEIRSGNYYLVLKSMTLVLGLNLWSYSRARYDKYGSKKATITLNEYSAGIGSRLGGETRGTT